jgi:DNA invertase Pin-like site-specific DNA recombinase
LPAAENWRRRNGNNGREFGRPHVQEAERAGIVPPAFLHLSLAQQFAPIRQLQKDLRQSGRYGSLPVATGCGGGQPGQILDKFNSVEEDNDLPNIPREPCLPSWFLRISHRKVRFKRRVRRRQEEIDAERKLMLANLVKEIDSIVKASHQALPRSKASATGIAYARYSTKFQHSIADQIRTIFEFAVKAGIFIPREYVYFDLATRGCKENRPGLGQVRGVLQRKSAEVLLVFTTNRLFRKNYKCMKFVEEEVVERGMRCVFVKTGIDTAADNRWRLPLQMHAMMDEMTAGQYTENIRAALEGLFLQGFVVTGLPFGYTGVEVDGPPTKAGKPRRKIAIDPETAPWVQQIFRWFVVDRWQQCEILRHLNDQDAPKSPMSNGYWSDQALVYLLQNECYRGIFHYGKGMNVWQSNKDYARRELRDEPLRTAVWEDLRLVSDELWFEAQKILVSHPQRNAGRKPNDGDRSTRPRLLNGILWCPTHNSQLKVGGAFGKMMYCAQCRYLPKARRPLYSWINRTLALQLTCKAIAEQVRADGDLVAKTIAACQKAAESLLEVDSSEIDKKRARVGKISSQIQFILDNSGESKLDQDESKLRIKQLRGQRNELCAEIARLQGASQESPKVPTEEKVRSLVAALDKVLTSVAEGNEPQDTATLRQILQIMTGGKIHLEQVGDRRAYRGFLRGRFKVCLPAALQEIGRIGDRHSDDEAREIVVDYRELYVAEKHVAAVMDLWNKGTLITAIAEQLGIDRHTVTDAVRLWHERNGLSVPPDGRARRATVAQKRVKPVDNTAKIAEIKRLYDQGMLIVKIAEKVGLERTTVRKYINEWCLANEAEYKDGRNRRKELEIKNRPKPSE